MGCCQSTASHGRAAKGSPRRLPRLLQSGHVLSAKGREEPSNKYLEAEALFSILRKKDILLLRGSWLLRRACFELVVDGADHWNRPIKVWKYAGGTPRPMPRRQDLMAGEPEAFMPVEEIERLYQDAPEELKAFSVPVLAGSYCWESAGDPDPVGRVLLAFSHIIAAHCGRKCRDGFLDFHSYDEYHEGYADVGVFVDFPCIHQKERSAEEEESFKRALKGINMIYGHRLTYSALLFKQDEHLQTARMNRGWPVFEELMSCMTKETSSGEYSFNSGRSKVLSDGEWGQKPILSPSDFDRLVEGLTFTSGSDRGMVARLYREAVVDALTGMKRLTYASLPWRDAELATLARTLDEVSVHTLEQVTLKQLEIELSGEGAAQLFEVLGRCSRLRYLNMANCQSIRAIPALIGRLTALKELSLSHCYDLEEVPEAVCQLTSLQNLDLSFTKIEELPTSFGQLSALTTLDLRGCKNLAELPEVVCQLTSLQKLSLGGMVIKELPASFGSLSALKELNMYRCESLSELPTSIGTLTALETLNMLGCSALKELPPSFGSLSALKELIMYECESLSELPASFGKLTALETLNLEGCMNLEELPVGNLVSLKKLDTAGCALKKIDLTGCSKLSLLPEPIQSLLNRPGLEVVNCPDGHDAAESDNDKTAAST